ncbi:hypothetical protein chiPu_0000253 [Chiloscyllium punctatum]|uniref:Uncharacterized protein n=1 Tax=Chiloscyllium punctatum TaxID=137246 RepID=A0A401RUS8_CHIPU|nr:hypothetical protein [Chiloscyllium punctatum]
MIHPGSRSAGDRDSNGRGGDKAERGRGLESVSNSTKTRRTLEEHSKPGSIRKWRSQRFGCNSSSGLEVGVRDVQIVRSNGTEH